MLGSADDIAFWIIALIVGAVALGLILVAAQWLLNRGYGEK